MMSDHTVVITGATQGLGRALAIVFATAGYRVVGIYAHNDEAAATLRTELDAVAPDTSLVLKHDIRHEDPELWQRDEIRNAARLVLINNAWPPFTPKPFHQTDWEEVNAGWEVGVQGAWRCAHALIRPMVRAGGGTIVNVLSQAVSGVPPKGFSAYVPAKHALAGMTIALAAEYVDRGVRVFSVSPGFMQTPFTASWDSRMIEAITSTKPPDVPAEIAHRILSLVESPETPSKGENHFL
jgi:NAD(P)-dependent dehydrogenase (short-subunit alcohol dehydrogenase family)